MKAEINDKELLILTAQSENDVRKLSKWIEKYDTQMTCDSYEIKKDISDFNKTTNS